MEVEVNKQVTTVYLRGYIKSDVVGYKKLVEFYHTCKSFKNKTIYIDFTALVWLDANLSALLQAILYTLHQENQLSFSIDVEYVNRRFDILFRNGFLKNLLNIEDGAGTTVEMKIFNPDQDVAFYTYLRNDLFGQQELNRSCTNQDEIINHILEVFGNIQLHAQTTDPVFACGQYYPKVGELRFTLLDLGRGYFPGIYHYTHLPNYYGTPVNTTAEAIMWALRGNSIKTTTTGGLGLSQLLKYCYDSKGELHIATGGVYFSSLVPRMPIPVAAFPGSLVQIIFNCNTTCNV